MELGTEINQKVKRTIKKQLQALDCYVDDELPDYIMVMIANKRTELEMIDDLNLFLGNEAEKFVKWLMAVLKRIKKAMELPNIEGLDDEKKKKSKKKNETDNIKSSKVPANDEKPKKQVATKQKTKEQIKPKEIIPTEDQRRNMAKQNVREKKIVEEKKPELMHEESEEDSSEIDYESEVLTSGKTKKKHENAERKKPAKIQGKSEQSNLRMLKESFESLNPEKAKREVSPPIRSESRRPGNPMRYVKQIARDISKTIKDSDDDDDEVHKHIGDSNDNTWPATSEYGDYKNDRENQHRRGFRSRSRSHHKRGSYRSPDDHRSISRRSRSCSPNRVRGRQPRSPYRRRRTTSKGGRSRSPYKSNRSHSRGRQKRLSSPHGRQVARSRSTHKQCRSRSPHRNQRSKSPEHVERSKTPNRCRSRSQSNDRDRNRPTTVERSRQLSRTDNKSKSRSRSKDKTFLRKKSRSKSAEKIRTNSPDKRTSRGNGRTTRSPAKSRLSGSPIGRKIKRSRSRSIPRRSKSPTIPTEPKNEKKGRNFRTENMKQRQQNSDENRLCRSPIGRKINRARSRSIPRKSPTMPKPKSQNKSSNSRTEADRKDVEQRSETPEKMKQPTNKKLLTPSPVRNVLQTENVKTNSHGREEKIGKGFSEKSESTFHQMEAPVASHDGFKRKLKVSPGGQATPVLLKRAVNQVVNERQPLIGGGNGDYTENVGTALHSNIVKSESEEIGGNHRVINIDKSLITVSLNARKDRVSDRRFTEEKHDNGEDKEDVRHMIKKSRQEHRAEKWKYGGSMVADIEEQQRQQQRQQKKERRRMMKKQLNQAKHSSDDEATIQTETLKQETRRIEMNEMSRQLPLGDLRELLQKDKQSSSDDEEKIAVKLREKIKEEKHKRLFGKLVPEELIKLKDERRSLRDKLKMKRSSSNQETINKNITSQPGNSKPKYDSGNDWVENECNFGSQEVVTTETRTDENEEEHSESINEMAKEDLRIEVRQNVVRSDDIIDFPEGSGVNDEQHEDGEQCSNEHVDGQPMIEDILDAPKKIIEKEECDTNVPKQKEEKQVKGSTERNCKHKSSKHRRMKHEFIVTLDGLEGGHKRFSIQTDIKKRESNSKPRAKSFSKNDRCEKEEQTRSHHRSSRRKHKRSREGERYKLAEQKQKAQELLMSKLAQVQNLDTTLTPKHKTFINPRFQGNLIQHDALMALSTQHMVGGQPVNTQVKHPETNPPMVQPEEPPEVTPLTTTSQGENHEQMKVSVKRSEVKSPTVTIESNRSATVQEKCVFWPDCKNLSCKFIHPTVKCKAFPNCSFGDRCLYIHPLCKFNERCSELRCMFFHHAKRSTTSTPLQFCLYGAKCTKMDCQFKHAIQKSCRFAAACTNPDCMYTHDKPATGASLKWSAEKPRISDRKFAIDESKVVETPVSIVKTT